jgi:hypothetical protein
MKKIELERRQAEMKGRLFEERLAPARRLRNIRANVAAHDRPIRKPEREDERAAWLAVQPMRQREAIGFREMGRKLDRYEKELRRERYVTAMLGVRTSWPRLEEYGKYYVFGSLRSDGGRRPERPEGGGNWPFQRRRAGA